jgi:hypothetical protein
METSTSTEIHLEMETDGCPDVDIDIGDLGSDAEDDAPVSPFFDTPPGAPADLVRRGGRKAEAAVRRLVVLSDAPELLFRLDPLPRRRRRSKALVRLRLDDR